MIQRIIPARPLYEDVDGAPVKIGAEVVIGLPCDGQGTAAERRGERGVIVHLEYECGCGQTYPGDPMIGVRFADGKVEEFWFEELEAS